MTRLHISPLGLATLAALGLAAVQLSGTQAARAQSLTLQSGDSITVSAAGTHGFYQGQPINNDTTAYRSGIGATVYTTGTAAFTLGAGGFLASIGYGVALEARGSGPVTVEGGVFTANGIGGFALNADNTSTVTVTGGSFSATGTNGIGLDASSDSTIDLFSLGDTPFLVNNVSMNNTTLAPNTFGTISGTLLDGQAFSTTFYNGPNATFNLNVGTPPVLPTPEPSSVTAFAVIGLGLAGLMLRARRRNASAA